MQYLFSRNTRQEALWNFVYFQVRVAREVM